MAHVAPPYLNKLEETYAKELLLAQKKEMAAKKDYEFAVEYRQLCEQKLEDLKNEK